MINLHLDKHLSIILPNTNKALAEVLKNASPIEIKTITQEKDLKSILTTILKQTSKDTSQDSALLKVLQNNPTLKELGKVRTTLKELLTTLKQEKNPLPLEKTLTKLLTNIKDIKEISPQNIKDKIQNAGVFLESKIKHIQAPRVELKSSIQELTKLIESSSLPNVKQTNNSLKELLNTNLFKNISNDELFMQKPLDAKSLSLLTQKVQTHLDKFMSSSKSQLDRAINTKDILFTKPAQELLHKVNLLNKPEALSNQTQLKELLGDDLKAQLLKTHEEVKNSILPNKLDLLKHIDKLSLHIDYYQLVSHLSDSSSLYIPFEFDALEDGHISIKNAKDGRFFCDIQLKLKEYGELNLRLGIFENNQLNINLKVENKEFKEILIKAMPQLKKELINAGLTPREIRFIEPKSSDTAYQEQYESVELGFEVKV